MTNRKENQKKRIEAKTISMEEFWQKEKDGLFKDVKPKNKKHVNASNPAIQSLLKINAFYEEHKREPSVTGPLEEKKLARALKRLREISDRSDIDDADIHGLLSVKPAPSIKPDNTISTSTTYKKPLKLDETSNQALAASILDVFGGGKQDNLFDTRGLSKGKLKNTQERYGKRTPCPDFHMFVPVFNQIKNMIDARNSVIEPFRRGNVIEIGDAFIWDGITCFVAEEIRMEHDSQGKPNPRLRIIFDNGTHADMLKQSFSQGMYRSVGTRRIAEKIDNLLKTTNKPIEERYGKKTGEIYFLGSHSSNTEVLKFKNLIKIGVTENTTPLRTRDAETESTYLYAPVRILKIIPCYNMNVSGLEAMIHTALHDFRKEIVLSSKKTGKTVTAREWFDIPVESALNIAIEIVKGSFPDFNIDEHGNIHKISD